MTETCLQSMSVCSKPTIAVFERSPDGGKGLPRDTRVHWTLEEVGRPYAVRPVSFTAMKEPAHRALHPFWQIPTYEEGEHALFESGAIVLHIAIHHEGLLPHDPNARARAINWMFAALGTIEPVIVEQEVVRYLERDEPWFEQRQTCVEDGIRGKLTDLSRRLGDADWLDGEFSAAYVARAEARPAFKRAVDPQRTFFEVAAAT